MVKSRLHSISAVAGFILATVGFVSTPVRVLAQDASAPSSASSSSSTDPPEKSFADDELSAEEWAEVEAAEAYVVEARAPELPEPGVQVDLEAESYSQDLASSLDAAPGARAVRSGGLLAPAELRVRGLGGSRLRIVLDGVPLDDPAGGQVDLADLDSELLERATLLRGPEAGTLAPGALAGALDLRTARPAAGFHARLRSALGSEQTALLASRASYGFDNGAVGLALRLGSSVGDFGYRSVSFGGDSALVGDAQQRFNNDQRRASVTATAQYDQEPVSTRLLAQASRHEGGLAGLSGHPTPRARFASESQLLGSRSLLFTSLAMLSLELSGRLRRERYAQPEGLAPLATDTRLQSLRAHLAASQERLLGFIDTSLALESSYAAAQVRSGDRASGVGVANSEVFTEADRLSGAGLWRGRASLLDKRLAVDLGLRVDALSDLGVEPSASMRLSAAVVKGLVLEGYVGRAFRPPTFLELHGPPSGYVRSNPELRPEDGIEGGLVLRGQGPRLHAELALFGARLDNTIVYLNRNAYEVRPENAGALWRGGGEGVVAVQATPWWTHSASAELLLSRMDVTGAALPATPTLVLQQRSELRFDGLWRRVPLRAFADLRVHSETASNLHGELRVPAQAAIDAGAAWVVAPWGSLSVEVHNLLDTQTRVDLRQVPLPGRQFLVTLVLGV
ncbi:MAG: TonB-dependent receptor [Pseudomonadota bacterium]